MIGRQHQGELARPGQRIAWDFQGAETAHELTELRKVKGARDLGFLSAEAQAKIEEFLIAV